MAKALTAKAVEKATGGPARREVPDGHLPGLYLVIQPSGSKSWAVRYRHHGAPKKLTLGPVAPSIEGEEPEPVMGAALSLAGARTLARARLAEAANGLDPAADRRQAQEDRLAGRNAFRTIAETFIVRHARPKNRSWKETARLLGLKPDPEATGPENVRPLVATGSGVVETWKGRDIGDIKRRDVIELLDVIADDGRPIVANRTLAAIRKLYNWALARGVVEESPCDHVSPPAAEQSRDRVLDDVELARVWHATRAMGYPFGPAIRLLILTGARRDEIGQLVARELGADVIALAGERTKNGDPHDIPLSPMARRAIAGLPKIGTGPGRFIFTGSGGRAAVSGWSRAKITLDARAALTGPDGRPLPAPAEIPAWRIHDLRRTCATGLQRLGIRLEIVEAVLGHISGSRAGVVGVYQRHAFAAEKREALDAWARLVALQLHPRVAAKVRQHVAALDVPAAQRVDVQREREAEMLKRCREGGRDWMPWLRSIARPRHGNVIKLRGVTA